MSSILAAKWFGIISVVLALAMLFNLDHARKLAKELLNSAASVMVAGLMPLILGGWVVVFHSNWQLNGLLVFTLIGWVMFLQGACRLLFASVWTRFVSRYLDYIPVLISLFGLIMGLALLYLGYVVSA